MLYSPIIGTAYSFRVFTVEINLKELRTGLLLMNSSSAEVCAVKTFRKWRSMGDY